MENNFKTADHLFAKIKEDFSSFNNSGLIDEGRFYSDIKYIIDLLGLNWYVEAQEILEVNNYQTELPENFKQLDFAYRCECIGIHSNNPGIVLIKQTFDHYPLMSTLDWHGKSCDIKNCHKPPSNCIFNSYEQILVQRDDSYYSYSNPILLKLGNVNTKRCCAKGCINIYSTSSDTITIQNRKIYTNFEKGTIYLSYYAFPTDSETGLPLVPDNSRILKCIEYYIKKNIIESLWVNGDADVAQKVSYFNQMYTSALGDAQYETKLPTFSSMVDKIRSNRKSLDVYYQLTNG